MGLLGGRWGTAAAVIALAAAVVMRKQLGEQLGWDNSAMMQWLKEMSDRLGHWAIPAYVGLHTITLALCLPYAVFFEAGASMLFGFLPALLCVFTAKILGASLSFWIGRHFLLSLFPNFNLVIDKFEISSGNFSWLDDVSLF